MDAIITAFASGKGGTGKSTAAVFTGGALAAAGCRVVLIELAPAMRSLDVIAGVEQAAVFDLEDVLSGRVAPGKALVESPVHSGLSLLLAPYANGDILAENVDLLCQRFAGHYDHVLLDVSSGRMEVYEAAAAVANRMALVLTPDTVALRDGRLLVDAIPRGGAVPRLLLNRVDRERVLKDGVLQDLDEAIDIAGAQLIGVVPESAEIARAATTGEALPRDSLPARVFDAIARRMLGEEAPLLVK